MRPESRPAGARQPERVEFVPKRELDRLQQENDSLRKENERLRQETERLRRELEAALRASKRPAAPHSRGEPKAQPKRPGRKPGRAYGRQACRPIPSRVEERIAVALPERCPHCGGGVEPESCEAQYQEEIVRRTIVRRFEVGVGHCRRCGRRVQGRHPWQTSDAVGVGRVQLGPEALTLAAILNKQMGLSLGHTQQVLRHGFGMEVSRAGLCRALARLAGRAQPTQYRHPANRRLAKHLRQEQPWICTFLHCPGLDATNHAAERAIRGMVIARKVWGGNRTWKGAHTQEVLVSVLRTCWQQGRDVFALLVSLWRAPQVRTLDIVPGPD